MLRVGFSRANITPYVGCPMAGYAAREGVASGIHDELWARAMVVDAGEPVAIVTADLAGLPSHVVAEIRDQAASAVGLKRESIMIATSHNHSGPAVHRGYQEVAAPCYVETLARDIAGAITAAWRGRTPSSIGVGTGNVHGVGVNRRHADGPVDPEVAVVKVTSPEGHVRGVLFNYTCHAVVLGPDNLLITADYPGYTQRMVERQIGDGGTAMFTNGAAGDVNTGHSADQSALGAHIPGRTFERAETLGRQLAWEVLRASELLECTDVGRVAAAAKTILLPQKKIPSLAEVEAAADQKRFALERLRKGRPTPEQLAEAEVEELYARLLLTQVRERTENGELDGPLAVEIQAIRIGDCGMIAFPGEVFVEIGLAIKRHAPFGRTFFVGYANGSVGYLPTRQAMKEGGYEAVQTRFAEGAAEVFESEAVDLLTELYG